MTMEDRLRGRFPAFWPAVDTVLSYSEYHFLPNCKTGRECTSAGGLAAHLYNTLLTLGTVQYRDCPAYVRTRLLLTVDCWSRPIGPLRSRHTVIFSPTSHKEHLREEIIRQASRCGLPVSAMSEADQLPQAAMMLAYQKALHDARCVIAVGNETTRRTFLEHHVDESKVYCLNCGIDGSMFAPRERPSGPITFVFPTTGVAFLKGAYHLTQAWSTLPRGATDAGRLVVLGDWYGAGGGAMEGLRNVCVAGRYDCGSEKHVSILNSAQYAVFPSLCEGQAGTLLEAMACGCVPIATRESGIDADKYGGWVIEAGSVESIRETLIQVVETHTSEQWARRSAITRESILRYHRWEDFNQRIYEICAGLLAR